MINVIINGAKGKMGQETCKAVSNDPELQLVATADLGDDLEKLIKEKKADVVVDFTNPDKRMEIVEIILSSGAAAVVGTTGFTPLDLARIDELVHEYHQGCLIAPNFAIGAVLMMQFAQTAAKHFSDVEIIEFHHNRKADAPSGTALKTAQLIIAAQEAAGINREVDSTTVETIKGSRGGKLKEINIHAVRMPGFVASQEVVFGSVGQTLKIRHDSIGRESFMPGVILAVKCMVSLPKLVYGLENLL